MEKDVSLSLLNSYKNLIHRHDEVIDHNGQVKPHWQHFFNTLEQLGLNELEVRNQEIINKLKENGVTYNVYRSKTGMNRPWILDPIPFIIHQKEWLVIEKGIKQRAQLLDLILKDIYGPQLLIKNLILPAELVFDNSGYLLPCFDIKQKLQNQLLVYACDLARGPDGKMWLLDNRTQSPSGSGYALENRSVMSTLIPEFNKTIYRARISPYFNHFQQTVTSLVPGTVDSANVVVLTPGPSNETYFEHTYLSSYLGYTLVQGSDLLVRDGFVWLKSIDELVRIDVIIKRVDDDWCDPLELRNDSLLGVPGLLEVIRLGNVAVMNPPGVGVLENYGLLAFMENACKFFLNESLLINSVATWWCGQEQELNRVLDNLPKLIIKKSNRKQGFKSVYCRTLTTEQLNELRNLIIASPKDFVAQEEVSFSTAPSYVNGKIEPRFTSIRTFVISNGNGYNVMPGGLTRSSASKDKFIISNQFGGFSKDTWIVTDTRQEVNEGITVSANMQHTKHLQHTSLTSRNAENLFWVGRITERTLVLTYFMRNLIDKLNENANDKENKLPEYMVVLLKSLTHLTLTYPGFVDEENTEVLMNPNAELLNLIFDKTKAGSIAYDVNVLLNTINQVTEKWNYGTRKIIYQLENSLSALTKVPVNPHLNSATKTLDNIYINLFGFYGNVFETLPRDSGYYLLAAGKHIERFLSLVSVLRSAFSFKQTLEEETMLMEVILENQHLLASFRATYKSHFNLQAFLNMMFLDANMPYTLLYIINELAHSLQQLPNSTQTNRLNQAEKIVQEAYTLIKSMDAETLIVANEAANYRAALDDVLKKVYELIVSLTTQLTSVYFNHTVLQHSHSDSIEKTLPDEL